MANNLDRLTNVDKKELSTHSFNILTKLQDAPNEVQAGALAVTFICLCDELGLNPQDIFTPVSNAIAYDGKDGMEEEHFGAVKDYIKYELGKR